MPNPAANFLSSSPCPTKSNNKETPPTVNNTLLESVNELNIFLRFILYNVLIEFFFIESLLLTLKHFYVFLI